MKTNIFKKSNKKPQKVVDPNMDKYEKLLKQHRQKIINIPPCVFQLMKWEYHDSYDDLKIHKYFPELKCGLTAVESTTLYCNPNNCPFYNIWQLLKGTKQNDTKNM